MEVVNIECPGCGATMTVDKQKKQAECPYCKTILPITDMDTQSSQTESQERIRLKELELEHQKAENHHRLLSLFLTLGILAMTLVAGLVFFLYTPEPETPSSTDTNKIVLEVSSRDGIEDEVQIVPITGTVYREEEFENALNSGENMEGTFVEFTVLDIHPQSTFGYDLWAGEHLNFVSSRNPDVKIGDTMTVKAVQINAISGSWIIYYQIAEETSQ